MLTRERYEQKRLEVALVANAGGGAVSPTSTKRLSTRGVSPTKGQALQGATVSLDPEALFYFSSDNEEVRRALGASSSSILRQKRAPSFLFVLSLGRFVRVWSLLVRGGRRLGCPPPTPRSPRGISRIRRIAAPRCLAAQPLALMRRVARILAAD